MWFLFLISFFLFIINWLHLDIPRAIYFGQYRALTNKTPYHDTQKLRTLKPAICTNTSSTITFKFAAADQNSPTHRQMDTILMCNASAINGISEQDSHPLFFHFILEIQSECLNGQVPSCGPRYPLSRACCMTPQTHHLPGRARFASEFHPKTKHATG